MQLAKEEKQIIDAVSAAKIFKFHLQLKNPNLKFIISLNKIPVKTFYAKYSDEFSKLVIIFNKYNLDIVKYIKFFIDVLDKREKDIKQDLVSTTTITKYIDFLKLRDKQDKIYNYFVKSAQNIVRDCIELGYFSTKDYIRHLITTKKLAEYYVSGKISLYYFAAIPNFKNIISKLDSFSKDEFQKIYDRFEMYNSEIVTAFIKKTNQKVNPIKYTDELLCKTRLSSKV